LAVAGRLTVDFRSATPSYRQLADQLRNMIRSGEIGPGEAIPSLKRMTQETELSMSTVQRAVRVLLDEGIVFTVPGRGSYAGPRDAD
jgi:GntR family transcriptional regulator